MTEIDFIFKNTSMCHSHDPWYSGPQMKISSSQLNRERETQVLALSLACIFCSNRMLWASLPSQPTRSVQPSLWQTSAARESLAGKAILCHYLDFRGKRRGLRESRFGWRMDEVCVCGSVCECNVSVREPAPGLIGMHMIRRASDSARAA